MANSGYDSGDSPIPPMVSSSMGFCGILCDSWASVLAVTGDAPHLFYVVGKSEFF